MTCYRGSPASLWTTNVVLFYVLVVVFTSAGAIKKKHCLEGDYPFFNGTSCAYRSKDPLDWENAVRLCMLLKSEKTLVDVIPSGQRKLMEKFLLSVNLTSLWIAVNRSVANRPLKYQLISGDGEFPVRWNEGRPESADIPWAMGPQNGSCVLLTSDSKTGTLGLRMEDCSRRYSVMCIMPPIDEKDKEEDVLEERNRLLDKFGHPDPEPTLQFRYNEEGNELYLRVDHPERMHRNLTKCYLEGATLTKNNAVELRPTGDAEFLVYTELEGYITCQARVSDSLQLVRTQRFLRRSSEEGQTYVLVIRHHSSLCRAVFCDPSVDSKFLEKPTRTVRDKLEMEIHADSVQAVKVDYRNEENVVITYRVQLSEDYVEDLSPIIRTIVSAVKGGGKSEEVLTVRSAEFCPTENKDGLSWPATRTGHTAVPRGNCRHSGGVPVTRQCRGDFVDGAYWDNPIGWSSGQTCDESLEREEQIQLLTTRNMSGKEKLKTLQDILTSEPRSQLKVSEIRAISEIFSNVTAEGLNGGDVPTIASITNSIMLLSRNESGSGSLGTAQQEFNTSNTILASLDNMMSGMSLASDTEICVESHFATLVVDVDGSLWGNSSSIRGIETRKSSNLQDGDVQTLSKTDRLSSDVVSAVLLPDSLFHNESSRHRVVINIFTSPELFGANSSSSFSPRHVISVTVNGTRQTLDGSLRLFFKREDPPGLKNPCVFWDFEGNDNKGMWSSEGCKLAEEKGYDVCMCGHLTHFSILIQTHSSEEEEPASLMYISIIGCSLSILGLCGIFVTAVAMPEWRKGTGKKLQLHFSMAVLMLMCSFLMLAAGGDHHERRALCIASGVLAHFSLLAVYSWTLVIAWYQYRRLTAPLQALDHAPHYLLITASLAWGSPFLLCSALLASNTDTYGPPRCYPYGTTHLVFVYIPVCSILVANIVIFLLIVWSIFECRKYVMKIDCQLNNNPLDIHRIKLRLVSSVYLFVLLSLCWVFGFLGWDYLFCITATMQGISLFLFFVILNKPTRERWRRLLQKRALKLRALSSS